MAELDPKPTSLMEPMKEPHRHLRDEAEASMFATGDFSRRSAGIVTAAAIILGALFSLLPVRSIIKPVREIIQDLRSRAEKVGSASAQVSSSSRSIAQGASEQAASLEETSSSLEEISSMSGLLHEGDIRGRGGRIGRLTCCARP